MKRLFIDNMRLLIIFVAFAVAVDAKRKGLLLDDDSVIKFDSISDTTENTEVLTFGTVQKPGHVTGIVFHDYTSRFLAAKLIDQGLCLIGAITDKAPEYVSPNLVKSPTPTYHTILRPVMTTEQMIAVAGARIADFCNGYNTHLMVEGQRHNLTPLAIIHCLTKAFEVEQVSLDSVDASPLR